MFISLVAACFCYVVLISLCCDLFPLFCVNFLSCGLFLCCVNFVVLWLVFVVLRIVSIVLRHSVVAYFHCVVIISLCCVVLISLCCDLFLLCCANFIVLRLVSVVLC